MWFYFYWEILENLKLGSTFLSMLSFNSATGRFYTFSAWANPWFKSTAKVTLNLKKPCHWLGLLSTAEMYVGSPSVSFNICFYCRWLESESQCLMIIFVLAVSLTVLLFFKIPWANLFQPWRWCRDLFYFEVFFPCVSSCFTLPVFVSKSVCSPRS